MNLENVIRMTLLAALLTAMNLGLMMAVGRRGRGSLTSPDGLTLVRTTIVAIIGPLLMWYLIHPKSISCPLVLADNDRLAGLVVFISGMSLRIWSQKVLGDQWSADISVRHGHKLVESGPYRWLRHPIYTSYLLIAPGLLFSTGNWLIGLLAIGYTLVSAMRIREEERMLLQVFGEEYQSYLRKRW